MTWQRGFQANAILIPPEKTRMLSGTPGVFRHQQCGSAWIKLRGWRLRRHVFPHTPACAKGHPKLWLLPVFTSHLRQEINADRHWFQHTSLVGGVTAWGSVGNRSAVSWESCHPVLRHSSAEGKPRKQEARPWENDTPSSRISVITYRKHTCTLSSFAVVTFSALLFREKPYSSYVKIIWFIMCLRFLAGF